MLRRLRHQQSIGEMLMVTAREIMRADDHHVTPADSVVAAARVMRDSALPQIPVCEDGRLVGVVSQRDIVTGCVASGRDPGRTCAGDLMRSSEAVVDADASIETALIVMAEHRVRGVPVLEGDTYLGVLAQDDATRSLLPDLVKQSANGASR
jgi:CBS domain-containing protein